MKSIIVLIGNWIHFADIPPFYKGGNFNFLFAFQLNQLQVPSDKRFTLKGKKLHPEERQKQFWQSVFPLEMCPFPIIV